MLHRGEELQPVSSDPAVLPSSKRPHPVFPTFCSILCSIFYVYFPVSELVPFPSLLARFGPRSRHWSHLDPLRRLENEANF